MGKIKISKIIPPKYTTIKSASTDGTGELSLVLDDNRQVKLCLSNLVDTNMYYTFPVFADEKSNRTEKLFTLQKENLRAIDFTDMGIVNEPTNVVPMFVIGEKYALSSVSCDGFPAKEKIYELVGVIDKFGGISVNSVIVKQVSGEQGIIFTLSKNDCDKLGIEYENGLQLFPKELSWTRVVEKKQFSCDNLSTTPHSEIDSTVRYILLKISGFKDYSDGYVITPSGKLIKEGQFEHSIRVTAKEPIVYGNGHIARDNTNLNIKVVKPETHTFNHGNFISSDNEVFILIDLKMNGGIEYPSFDHCFGVETKYLDGIDPSEFFNVMWDEFGALTVEEYEAEKKRKEKEEAERIKREEEKLKHEAEEKARREEEKRLMNEAAVKRMKNLKIHTPVMPKIPKFNMDIDTIAGFDMYIDSLDDYFKGVDEQLRSIDYSFNMLDNKLRGYKFSKNNLLDDLSDLLNLIN